MTNERMQQGIEKFDYDLDRVCSDCGEFPEFCRCVTDAERELVDRLEMFVRAVIADAEESDYPNIVNLRENREALLRALNRASKNLRNSSVRKASGLGDGAER